MSKITKIDLPLDEPKKPKKAKKRKQRKRTLLFLNAKVKPKNNKK